MQRKFKTLLSFAILIIILAIVYRMLSRSNELMNLSNSIFPSRKFRRFIGLIILIAALLMWYNK